MPLMRPDLTFVSELKYDLGKIIPFMDAPVGCYDILSSAYCSMIRQLPRAGSYTIIKEVYRPDLVAYKIYKSVKYKIPLMMYNNMYTIKEFYKGRVVDYPSVNSLDELLFALTK